MKILAIETSADQGSLALSVDDCIRLVELDPGPAQSASALAKLAELLGQAGLELVHLDAIAFGTGPGMFTGLRFGCGLAQGLALGSGLPLIAVSSQIALAARCAGEHILVATDARMGEVYWRCFRRGFGDPQPLTVAECTPPEQIRIESGGRWHGIGNAFAIYRDRLPAQLLERLEATDAEATASAREIAQLAMPRLAAGEFTPLAEAVPEYVRDKVALTTAERRDRGGAS